MDASLGTAVDDREAAPQPPGTCLVNVHNEWDPLEEMIVGSAYGAQVPMPDRGLFALDYCQNVESPDQTVRAQLVVRRRCRLQLF